MTNHTEIVQIPVKQLMKWDGNVRKTGADSIAELAASIRAHGIIHNLSVFPQLNKKRKPTGKFKVAAGGRRHDAVLQLVDEGFFTEEYLVPCLVVDEKTALEISLAENIVREAMHPADEFLAFKLMIEGGVGIEDVAARFGITCEVVRKRLKLANVSPRLFDIYRHDGMNLSQLMALAVTENNEAQERVWDGATQHWQREPRQLRAALTEGKIDASTDARARFVGTDIYAAAGGAIEQDLFQESHEGYLTDGELLNRLVAEKLQTLRETVQGDGWKWVEVQINSDFSDLSRFSRIYPVAIPLASELQQEKEALESEQEKIHQKHDGDEYPEGVQSRLDEIENRLDEIEELGETEYSAEQKGFAGVIISLRNDGQPDIHRGLVKTEDKRQMNTVKSGGSADTSGITEVDQGDSGLSAALIEDLTTNRTAAMRAELIAQPNVALVTITHNLAVQVCFETPAWDLPTTVAIAVERNSLPLDGHAKDIESSPAQRALNEKREHFHRILPEDPKKLWDWLLERDQSEVMDLLVFCVAQTVNAIRLPHQSSLSRHAAADDLAAALSLDMTAWWMPTVDGYLGRVKKDRLIADLIDAIGEVDDVEALKAMKKTDLAAEVATRLANTRWLPGLLRA